jgi:prepilin-type N-terminal cleavage/methylation domain-containing protein
MTRNPARRHKRLPRAFTLLEMVIVITVIAILAGSLVPQLTRPYVSEYRVETLAEMQAIEAAIVGRPELGDFGFVGHMGRLPTTVTELWTQGANSTLALGASSLVPMGWGGPYIKSQFQRPDRDAWGNPYVIDLSAGGNWRLRSFGPDGATNTADDITYPQPDASGTKMYFNWTGNLTIDLLVTDGMYIRYFSNKTAQAAGIAVTLYKPDSTGAETSVACTMAPYAGTLVTQATCSNVPFGIHHVVVAPTVAITPAVTTVSANLVVARPNSYARLLMAPPTNESVADTLPQATIVTVNAGQTSNVTTLTTIAPMPKFITYLDFEVMGTLKPSDATTTCAAWLQVTGAASLSLGKVQVFNAPGSEVPFHISVNAADPKATGLLTLDPTGAAINVAVQVSATSTSGGFCSLGTSTNSPTTSNVLAYAFHYMQQ